MRAWASDLAACRVAARRLWGRLHVPDRLGASSPVRRPQTATAAPILTTTKPGRPPPQEIAARRRALPSKAVAESDFYSTRHESRQFFPHGWIEDRRWFPLSQFKPFTPKLAVLTLAAAARRARIGANTSPAVSTRGQANTSLVSIQTWPPATQIDLGHPLTASATFDISNPWAHPWRWWRPNSSTSPGPINRTQPFPCPSSIINNHSPTTPKLCFTNPFHQPLSPIGRTPCARSTPHPSIHPPS